jgi:hypothetical protein
MLRFLKEGDAILFKRNTDFTCQWEPGVYIAVDREGDVTGNGAGKLTGWHRVKDMSGARCFIPTRRLSRPQDDPA